MKIELLEVAGFLPALHGMRNAFDSWYLNDSVVKNGEIIIGDNDLKLAQKLILAGGEHSKFMRQIKVFANMTMPRYFWQEFDTYHFNTKNSCSTIHTIMKKPLTIDDFFIGFDIHDHVKNKVEQKKIPSKLKVGEKEEWRDIIGYDGIYKISNLGEIYKKSNVIVYDNGMVVNKKGKIVKPSVNSSGYLKVVLHHNKQSKNKYLHRLIAEHFIENPTNAPMVNHKDGNKLNNNISNLEWVTAKENDLHASKNNLRGVSLYNKYRVSQTARKFSFEEVKEIKELYEKGKTKKEISLIYNCYDSIICGLLNEKNYKDEEIFSHIKTFEKIIDRINELRIKYLETKDYEYVIRIKRILPEGFLQKRTVDLNYAEIRNIYFQRRNHKLKTEWVDTFCRWVESLPYAKELIMLERK